MVTTDTATEALMSPDMTMEFLPDPNFTAELAHKWTGQLLSCDYAISPDHPRPLEDPVLKSTPLKDVSWATLFAYMHRRFGLPNIGCDRAKDLSAAWSLTTPLVDFFVIVQPHVGAIGFNFDPKLRIDDAEKIRFKRDEISPERAAEIKAAYRTFLLDLLRPVQIDDKHINALGEIDTESDFDLALIGVGPDEDDEPDSFEVKYHDSCGTAIPAGIIGTEEWYVFVRMMYERGDNLPQSFRQMLNDLQSRAFDELSGATVAVQNLVMLADYGNLQTIGELIGLSDSRIEATEKELQILCGNAPENREAKQKIIAEFDDATIAEVMSFCRRLGFDTRSLEFQIDLWKDQLTATLICEDLMTINAGDLPDEMLGSIKAFMPDIVEKATEKLRSMGRLDLVDWISRSCARTNGKQLLSLVLGNTAEMYRKARLEAAAAARKIN